MDSLPLKKGEKMELAWHRVTKEMQDFPDDGFKKFISFYPGLKICDERLEEVLSRPARIYMGDEFCPARLPDRGELQGFFRMAEQKGLPLTLLTPVLTDPGIKACSGLFEHFSQWDPGAEVVVNDLGVLFYLKKKFPDFQLSMGRLFNKGFKDPRLEKKELLVSEETKAFLNDCSFQRENIQHLAGKLGIQRFEQDLLPHADPDGIGTSGLKTSVYFPFGYVTTGRVCLTAGIDKNPETMFGIINGCGSPCATLGLRLQHPKQPLELFQNGNTIFYSYTDSMIKSLFKNAESHGLRLVYQGGLL